MDYIKKTSFFDNARTILKSNLHYNNKGRNEFRIFLEADNVKDAGGVTFDYENVINQSYRDILESLAIKYQMGITSETWTQDDINFTEMKQMESKELIEIIHNVIGQISLKGINHELFFPPEGEFDLYRIISFLSQQEINSKQELKPLHRSILLRIYPDKFETILREGEERI